jgi:hypothetical protein
MIFCLQCAQTYAVSIVLVHDLASCLFPNPAALPMPWQDSKLFDDKAYTFLGEYAPKVAQQIHHKYELLGRKGADIALVYSEYTESTRVQTFCNFFEEISTSRIVLSKKFLERGVAKVTK